MAVEASRLLREFFASAGSATCCETPSTSTRTTHRDPRGSALRRGPRRAADLSLVLNLLITLLQVVGGIVANSLGLLSDAAHNLSDVVALGLSLWAVRLGRRGATPHRTFAYKRAEILVALFNSAVLVAISVYIIVEAVRRLLDPPRSSRALGHRLRGRRPGHQRFRRASASLPRTRPQPAGRLPAPGRRRRHQPRRHDQWPHRLSVATGTTPTPSSRSSSRSGSAGRRSTIVRSTVNVLMEGTPEGVEFAEVEQALLGDTGSEGCPRPPHLVDLVQRPGSVGPRGDRGHRPLRERQPHRVTQTYARPPVRRRPRNARARSRG